MRMNKRDFLKVSATAAGAAGIAVVGMDGHESVNFVHGEQTLLAPGMCFSNEPGLYDFAAFGVRLEDCLHMTEDGPAWFTVPPDSLEGPIGRMG